MRPMWHELLTNPDWVAAKPWVLALLATMVLDVFLGLMVAFGVNKNACSTVHWKGITRKIGTIGAICLAGIVDPLLPVELAKWTTIAYLSWEGMSITEKLGALGVWVPRPLKEALIKLREMADTDYGRRKTDRRPPEIKDET